MRSFWSKSLCRVAFVSAILGFFLYFPVSQTAYASFNIKEDGFSISNAPGYCFAMAAFSKWYYLNRHPEAPLRKTLNKQIQTRIAKELQEFYSKNLIKIQAEYCNRYHGNQSSSFRRFVVGLTAGEPRIVLLMNKSSTGAVLHAVLAYAWIPERNVLKIYDPNYIQEERYLDLEKNSYTSLDITYHAICFPEALEYHPGLITKMEYLYAYHAGPRRAAAGPVAEPEYRRASAPILIND